MVSPAQFNTISELTRPKAHGFWHSLNTLFAWLFFLYFAVRLFQRRLGWFAEKLWGFLLFWTVAYVSFFVVAGSTGNRYQDHPAILIIGVSFAVLIGALWVVYSARTWQEAHARAVGKANAKAAARKAQRQAVIRDFLGDVLLAPSQHHPGQATPTPYPPPQTSPEQKRWVSPDGKWEWVEGQPVRQLW